MRGRLLLFGAYLLLLVFTTGSRGDDAEDRQLEAIARIKSLGGEVEIDASAPEAPTMSVRLWRARGDDALVHLRDLPGITELYLDNPRVTDAGLANVRELVQLKTLVLSGFHDTTLPRGFDFRVLATIGGNPRLVAARITNAGLENLAALTELRELRLSGTNISSAGLRHLGGLTKLETLWLNSTAITDAGLAHLANCKQLKWLDLADTAVTDAGLVELRPFAQLRELNLLNAQVGDRGVAHLRALLQLGCLVLDGTALTDRGLETLCDMPQLDWLVLGRTRVTDAGLLHLAKLPKLKVLHLEENQITDARLAHLTALTKLTELVLNKTQVTDAGLAHLARMASLECLYLRGTQITDAQLKMFTRMKNLRTLNLQETQVSAEGVEDLQQAMPICHVMWLPRKPAAAREPVDEDDGSDVPEDYVSDDAEFDSFELDNADLATLAAILATDRNPVKRRAAAVTIGERLDHHARPRADDDDWPGENVINALVAASRDDPDDVVRVAAVYALAKQSPFPWNIMAECLACSSPRARLVAAAHISGQYEKPESGDEAEDAASEDEDDAEHIAEVGEWPVRPASESEHADATSTPAKPEWLTRALSHDDPVVRGLAALAAEEESPDRKAALPVLLEVLRQEEVCPTSNHFQDPWYGIEEMALAYVGMIGPDAVDVVPWLIDRAARLHRAEKLSDAYNRPAPPIATARAIVGIGRPAVPVLVEHVTNRHGTARLIAAFALAGIGEHRDKAIPVLIRSLYDEDSSGYCFGAEFHRHDVAALAVCGHEAVPALLEARQGYMIALGAYAALTMMKHDAEAVVPLLVEALADGDAATRRMVAGVLLFFDEEAEPAVPALQRALTDPDEDVAEAATSTLARFRMRSFGRIDERWPDAPSSDDDLEVLAELVRLDRLNLHETKITGTGLVHLRDFENLRELILPRTFTDAGMDHLGRLQTLEILDLSDTRITDAGMEGLRGLTNLRELDLRDTRVTDAGVAHLGCLTKLRELNLHGTGTTDSGVVYLTRLANLQKLDLGYTQVADAGIEHLGQRLGLKHLDLRGTQVSDACLGELARLKNLEYLALSNHITDAELLHLPELHKLRHLSFGTSKVSSRAIARLREALPECTIWHAGSEPGRRP